jgi:hypothetical protein
LQTLALTHDEITVLPNPGKVYWTPTPGGGPIPGHPDLVLKYRGEIYVFDVKNTNPEVCRGLLLPKLMPSPKTGADIKVPGQYVGTLSPHAMANDDRGYLTQAACYAAALSELYGEPVQPGLILYNKVTDTTHAPVIGQDVVDALISATAQKVEVLRVMQNLAATLGVGDDVQRLVAKMVALAGVPDLIPQRSRRVETGVYYVPSEMRRVPEVILDLIYGGGVDDRYMVSPVWDGVTSITKYKPVAASDVESDDVGQAPTFSFAA